MSQDSSSSTSASVQDLLVSAPVWAVALTLGILVLGAGGAGWVVLHGGFSEELRGAAGQVLAFSLPVLALTIGAVAASRSGTASIDRLVRRFLDETVLRKLCDMCVEQTGNVASLPERTPPASQVIANNRDIRAVRLVSTGTTGSFATYALETHSGLGFEVTVKMNVFNIEVICLVVLKEAPPDRSGDESRVTHVNVLPEMTPLTDRGNAEFDPLVHAAANTLQGAVAEGYVARVGRQPHGHGLRVSYSVRQKLRENLLTSPYLRRYFAEDIAIWVRCLYGELRESALRVDADHHRIGNARPNP